MSQPRFAPITGALLARKGSAAPSSMMSFTAMAMPDLLPMDLPPKELPPKDLSPKESSPKDTPPPVAVENHAHHDHDTHNKKLFVSLSHAEHERLAIAAVKTGLTRHQLIRDALDLYFEQLSRDLGQECRCVAGTVCLRSC